MTDRKSLPTRREVPTPTVSITGAPAAAPELPKLGRYEVVALVGEGGMGQVYLGRDPSLDREVAIKLVQARGEKLDDAARLLREGRALARVHHPNVVPVYDVDVTGDHVYLVMPFVAGGTLRTWLRDKPRTWREILDQFLAAGRGLCAAHAEGLVHRDFKPENVLLDETGQVFVADFGLARGSLELGPGVDAVMVLRVTQTGVVAGTPKYMAPEQLSAAPIDARCDQFAFAVALWEALLGVHPFGITATDEEISATELVRRIALGPGVPPAHELPPELVAALRRALAISPEARWASLTELLDVLAEHRRPRRRWLWFAGAVAIAAAAVIVGVALHGGPASVVSREASGPVVGHDASVDAVSIACTNASECRAACDRGDQGACLALGDMLQKGAGIAKDAAAAHALFVTACDRGDRRGCVACGLDLLDGTGVLKDLVAGAAAIVKACRLGSPPGCGVLGDLQLRGEGVAKDAIAARESYHIACEATAGQACLSEGVLYFEGTGGAKDAAKAHARFERACTGKIGDGCLMLGNDRRKAKDAKGAVEAYQRGCDLGSSKACFELGYAYRDGEGIAVDRAQAKRLWEAACKDGLAAACQASHPQAPAPPVSGSLCSGYGSWGMVCGGSCTNTYNDNINCGNCGIRCPGASYCSAGRCTQ